MTINLTNEKAGMVFIMVPLDGNYRTPILAQIEDYDKFVFEINNNKFVTLSKAALITKWTCAEKRFTTDELGWIDNFTISTSNIKWCIYY